MAAHRRARGERGRRRAGSRRSVGGATAEERAQQEPETPARYRVAPAHLRLPPLPANRPAMVTKPRRPIIHRFFYASTGPHAQRRVAAAPRGPVAGGGTGTRGTPPASADAALPTQPRQPRRRALTAAAPPVGLSEEQPEYAQGQAVMQRRLLHVPGLLPAATARRCHRGLGEVWSTGGRSRHYTRCSVAARILGMVPQGLFKVRNRHTGVLLR